MILAEMWGRPARSPGQCRRAGFQAGLSVSRSHSDFRREFLARERE